MPKLVCHCLNVQIFSKLDPKPVNLSLIESVKRVSSGCGAIFGQFFDQTLSEVTLNLEGIRIIYSRLLNTQSFSKWTVHRCVNCGINTHATNTENPGNVLVFSGLLIGDAEIDNLVNSEDYSPLYKIVLRNGSESTPISADLMSPEIRDELQTIQKRLNSFLVDEESSMERRIRFYGEEEREKYAQLQSKARTQKNVLMARMLSAAYKNVSDSLSSAIDETSDLNTISFSAGSPMEAQITFSAKVSADRYPDVEGEASSVASNDNEDFYDEDFVPPLPRQLVSRSNSTTKRSSDSSPVIISKDFHTGHVPVDDVFQFDPGFQDDPNQPFSESDEEVNDTDDSSLVDDGSHRSGPQGIFGSRKSDSQSKYSTSVPINVPAWMVGGTGRSQMNQYEDEEDGAVPQDAESMAASIKALARSVHGNTSEIFGELPKPPTRARVVLAHSSTAR